MNFSKSTFFALGFAFMLSASACSTTDTGTTDTDMTTTDSTEMTTPDNSGMENGTGGDTAMNNDGMQNNGGAVIDTTDPNNKPNEDGRLPVRGKK